MSLKGPFQPNPIYDFLIINWKSVNYEMLINTDSSWNTFLASTTRNSNPTHTQVLSLWWAHAPSALTLLCSCAGRFSSFLWGGWVALFFPSLPWLLWALCSHVWPCSTDSGWWDSSHDTKQHMLPMLPARRDIHSKVPTPRVCHHSRISQPPLLLFIPFYIFLR